MSHLCICQQHLCVPTQVLHLSALGASMLLCTHVRVCVFVHQLTPGCICGIHKSSFSSGRSGRSGWCCLKQRTLGRGHSRRHLLRALPAVPSLMSTMESPKLSASLINCISSSAKGFCNFHRQSVNVIAHLLHSFFFLRFILRFLLLFSFFVLLCVFRFAFYCQCAVSSVLIYEPARQVFATQQQPRRGLRVDWEHTLGFRLLISFVHLVCFCYVCCVYLHVAVTSSMFPVCWFFHFFRSRNFECRAAT